MEARIVDRALVSRKQQAGGVEANAAEQAGSPRVPAASCGNGDVQAALDEGDCAKAGAAARAIRDPDRKDFAEVKIMAAHVGLDLGLMEHCRAEREAANARPDASAGLPAHRAAPHNTR